MIELTGTELAEAQVQWGLTAEEEAEHARLVAACVATHGEHTWELELEHPEDGAGISLGCVHCPAGVDDVFVDGHEFIGIEFDGVLVEDGRHNSPVPLVVPVTVEVWTTKHWTDYGYEYDAGLQCELRGPAREVTE